MAFFQFSIFQFRVLSKEKLSLLTPWTLDLFGPIVQSPFFPMCPVFWPKMPFFYVFIFFLGGGEICCASEGAERPNEASDHIHIVS